MTVLIETINVWRGSMRLRLDHMARLSLSCHALGLALPSPAEGDAVDAAAAAAGDGVLRVTWNGTMLACTTRPMDAEPVHLVTVRAVHAAYPHKTDDRRVFDAAQHEAAPREPLLLTAAGHVAEAARFGVLWIEDGRLCVVDPALGVLPSVGVARVRELDIVYARRVSRHALSGAPVAVVNAVRGVTPVTTLDGEPVPPSPRWGALQAAFWSA